MSCRTWRGRPRIAHLSLLGKQSNCLIVAVCDVSQETQERAVAHVEKAQGHKPKVYTDMRQPIGI